MGEWCTRLVQGISAKGFGYLDATELRANMAPEDFEAELGRFLRSIQAFADIKPLLKPSCDFPAQETMFLNKEQWEPWHSGVAFHLEQITAAIHESLYELYAAPAVDSGAAEAAYDSLLREMGLAPGGRWVYATTNYDTIGEDTIVRLGRLPDVGEAQTSFPNAERDIRVERLLDGMPRYVPVLHLHGRVGWLRRPDGHAFSTPLQRYDQASGVPIVMLPDLEKNYATDPVISTLWQQFGEAVSRAKRVLVVGHSLHDAAMMDTLRANVDPAARLGVTVLPDGDDTRDVADRVARQLQGARVIPMRFGGQADDNFGSLRAWH